METEIQVSESFGYVGRSRFGVGLVGSVMLSMGTSSLARPDWEDGFNAVLHLRNMSRWASEAMSAVIIFSGVEPGLDWAMKLARSERNWSRREAAVCRTSLRLVLAARS